MRICFLAPAVACAGLAASPAAALLDNHLLAISFGYVAANSAVFVVLQDGLNLVGSTGPTNFIGNSIAVTPSDSFLLIAAPNPLATTSFTIRGAFEGFRISDFNNSIAPFTGATITINNVSGFTASRVSFDPDNIYLNFGGLMFSGGEQIGISVTGMAAGGIPEPANWAMLIAGFGLTGAALRRRAVITG